MVSGSPSQKKSSEKDKENGIGARWCLDHLGFSRGFPLLFLFDELIVLRVGTRQALNRHALPPSYSACLRSAFVVLSLRKVLRGRLGPATMPSFLFHPNLSL